MPYEDYDKIEAVRWSHLKLLLDKSLAHYRWAADHPDEGDTPSRQLLRAIHCAVLEPEVYETAYMSYSERRNSAVYKARIIANPGVELIREKDAALVWAMTCAAHAHPVAGPILTGPGWSERTVSWTHPATGIPLKARIDRITPDPDGDGFWAWDLKTVGASAAEHDVRRLARRLNWIGQLAHYREGLQSKQPTARIRCGLICLEDRPPYDVGVYRLRERDLYDAAQDREVILAELKEAMDSDHWPGLCEEVDELNMTPWADEEITGLEEAE